MRFKGFIQEALVILSGVLIGSFMGTRTLAGVAAPTGLVVRQTVEIPPTFFGMHIRNRSNWPTVSIGALGKGNTVRWVYIEPSRGVFNWSELDQWVNLAHSHGVTIFWSNSGVPPWAAADTTTCRPAYVGASVQSCSGMVANIRDWDHFITALATRYKGKLMYELWNEPNSQFTGTFADMVTLTTHQYDIVRAIDRAATVIAPSATPDYLDNWWAAGGVRSVDVVSFHGYPHWGSTVPNAPEDFYSYRVQPLQLLMAKYGLSGKPIWDTEGLWGKSTETGAITDPQTQVGYVARNYLLNWSYGVSRAYWYAWDEPIWGTLWDSIHGPRPAATAYQQVTNWMVGATLTVPCSTASDSTWACGFSRPGGYEAQAIWNTVTTKAYKPDSKYTQYRDLSGHVQAIPNGGTVTIGAKPILLETGFP